MREVSLSIWKLAPASLLVLCIACGGVDIQPSNDASVDEPDATLVDDDAAPVAWFDDNYQKRRPFEFDNRGRVAEAGFPLPVRGLLPLPAMIDGAGVRFVADDQETELAYSVENDVVWVRVDLADDAITRFWAYYDPVTATTAADPARVFAGFDAVYPLSDDFGFGPPRDPINDVTGNDIHFANFDNIDASDREVASFGAGLRTSAASNPIALTEIAHPSITVDSGASKTFEVWFRTAGDPTGQISMSLLDNTNATAGIAIAVGQLGSVFVSVDGGNNIASASGGPFNDDNWHHVALTVDRDVGALTFFVDGVLEGNAAISTASPGTPGVLTIGQRPLDGQRRYDGVLDEIRIGPGRSADWIAATFASSLPGAVAPGDEELLE